MTKDEKTRLREMLDEVTASTYAAPGSTVAIERGKYTFIYTPGSDGLFIHRHGAPWVGIEVGSNAVVRLVYAAAEMRRLLESLVAENKRLAAELESERREVPWHDG